MPSLGPPRRLTDFASCAGCAGKIAPSGITEILRHLPRPTDQNVLVGTETHDDAGIYRLTDEIALVQTVDFFPPVVDDPYVYGQIAAANALSDVYAMGGTPKTALNIVGYPDDELGDFEWLGLILQGGAERCAVAGTAILGGHSVRQAEIKFGLAVTGIVHPQRFWTNAGARPGDLLVLTKPLGTGFVTSAAKKDACPPDVLQAACASMIQLNVLGRDALLAVSGVHAVTDVTGFGLAGHAYEMAAGSDATLAINLGELPTIDGVERHHLTRFRTRASRTNAEYVKAHCRIEGTPDPVPLEFAWDAQTSGGLLISIESARAKELIRELQIRGSAAAAIVGEVRKREEASLVLRS
ncbi:MAG: selenide, water dikinase SelD [Planctomycetes bacterium]|nr:selenide, water dikinase SelD [Planctomycetota bacterium]